MAGFLHDIPEVEIILFLLIMMLCSIALKAFIYRRDMTQEDKQFLIHWFSRGLIGLTILFVGLKIITLVAR